jgi:hypothetical protein
MSGSLRTSSHVSSEGTKGKSAREPSVVVSIHSSSASISPDRSSSNNEGADSAAR